MNQPDITTDIAVIGAGVAGTYAAYRLTKDTGRQVAVFEANNRVGGRLWSHYWPEADTMVELGGEAFSAAHANVAGLARKELDLTIAPHNAFNTLHRCFLRNKLIKPIDMLNRQSYPHQGQNPEDIAMRYFMEEDYFTPPSGKKWFGDDTVADPFEAVANHLLKHLSKDVSDSFYAMMGAFAAHVDAVVGYDENEQPLRPLTPDEAADFVTPELYRRMSAVIRALESSTFTCSPLTKEVLGRDTVPTHNLDFWSMVVNDLGQEAYALFRAAGYDNTSALSFNLVELLDNLLLGPLLGMTQPNFWTVDGGFDQLPKTMMRRAVADGSAALYLEHRLASVHRYEDEGIIELQFLQPGADRPVIVHANRVVMSAPVQAFDHGVSLTGFDQQLTDAFAHRRGGISSIAAGKLYLVYPRPWWSDMTDIDEGEDPLWGYASTDMPSRAVYYKGTIGDTGKALMTGALTDSTSSDFWTGFLSPDAPIFPGVRSEDRRSFAAPVAMVSSAQGILERMHQERLPDAMPHPELAMYHEWRDHGGGWSAWKSGRNIHNEAALLRQPFKAGAIDQGLYCCGDSVSERHGWVENTLESAEAMLREAFELDPASWLPSGDRF